jgi:hypothetical protein
VSLSLKIPAGDNIFVQDALRIVEEASKRGLILRIMGALAIRLHSPELGQLQQRLDRLGQSAQQFTDLDFVGYGAQRSGIYRMFKDMNYELDRTVAAYYGHVRGIWYQQEDLYHVDVFYDKLAFSHEIFLGSKPGNGRLELDYPTVALADLILEKTQIHDIAEKDIKDLIILLLGHELADQEKETINVDRLAGVLKNDWGFYHDFQINVGKILEFADCYRRGGKLTDGEFEDIRRKAAQMLNRVENEPKTNNWKKREKVGTSKQWWESVEEVER